MVAPLDTVLAIDVGTSYTKVRCFHSDARTCGPMLSVPTPIRTDGTADAMTFVEAVESAVDRFCARPPEDPRGKPVPIRGCALTCSWHGLAGLDSGSRPVTALSTWMNASAGREAADLRALVGDEDAVHDRTGCRIHPSYPAARLLRLRRREPDAWSRVVSWVTIGELLQTRWCGPDVPASYSMASGSGLFDSRENRWDGQLMELVGVEPSALRTVSDDWRSLSPEYRRRWPPLADAAWGPSIGDGACSIVGSGAASCRTTDGKIMRGSLPGGLVAAGGAAALSLGTSAAVRVLVEREKRLARPLRPAIFAYALDAERPVVGVSRSNALNVTRWAQRVLRLPEWPGGEDLVEHIVKSRLPGSVELTISSALAGERSPDWPLHARGMVDGLSLATSPLDIAQALIESAVVGLVRAVRELELWAGPLDLILSGGGARSPGWQRMMADGFGRPIVLSDAADTSLRGAALVCLEKLGLLHGDEQCGPSLTVIEPDPVRAQAFAELIDREDARAQAH